MQYFTAAPSVDEAVLSSWASLQQRLAPADKFSHTHQSMASESQDEGFDPELVVSGDLEDLICFCSRLVENPVELECGHVWCR